MINPLSLAPRTIHLLTSGAFALDGGAMFGAVPKALWQRSNPADEANRITLLCRHWLIDHAYPAGGGISRRILVDTGIGNKLSEKEVRIYRKYYNTEKVPGTHIAPHTLDMAAMWAVLTRLEEPKKHNLSLLQKLKLYDGKTLPGFTQDNITNSTKAIE